jgi:hypothetical protein
MACERPTAIATLGAAKPPVHAGQDQPTDRSLGNAELVGLKRIMLFYCRSFRVDDDGDRHYTRRSQSAALSLTRFGDVDRCFER